MKPRRQRRLEFIERRLLRKHWPRLQVSLILFLTGVAGLLTSFGLLHLGVSRMWLRYPIAIIVAYAVFLALLSVWLWLQRHGPNVPDFSAGADFGSTSGSGDAEIVNFGGGNAGGGGAGGGWDKACHQ